MCVFACVSAVITHGGHVSHLSRAMPNKKNAEHDG